MLIWKFGYLFNRMLECKFENKYKISIGVFLWKSWNKISEIEKTGYLVIITGGLLNALERTIFGSVTDFISVQYFSVFNMADMAITG